MSSTLKLPKDQVESLRPRDVQLYLSSQGWVINDGGSSDVATSYHNPKFGDAEILLPLRRDFADFALRMSDVVQTLAILQRKSIWEILNALSGPPSDVLRLRVASSETTLGNVPLDEGIRLLRGGRDMLLSAACSVVRPRAFHPEKPFKDARDFIEECRLGQTERGSFVATIIAPVPPMLSQRSFMEEDEAFQKEMEPFARQVTTRLMSGLELVDHAVKEARLDPILEGIENGVSANLCDAVVAMRPAGDQSRVDIRMTWSRSRPRLPVGVPDVVTFGRADFEIIEEASRRLRERARPERERFEGKIVELRSLIASLYDDLEGKVVLRAIVGGQIVRIKIVLNRDDYRRACDAHRDDRLVAVSGIIHHDVKVRVYELSEPRDFEVFDIV